MTKAPTLGPSPHVTKEASLRAVSSSLAEEAEAKSRREPQATWRPRGLSKSVISRVIIGVIPLSVLTTLLITYLLSPLGL